MELPQLVEFHKAALRLNTSRNAFEYVLRARKYRKVYMPFYTCEVMMAPLKKLGVSFEYYRINKQLEPIELPTLKDDEAFLYTNYFGLKQSYVKRLSVIYGNQLIVDNAQAFYAEPVNGIDTFYSARKFFGLPDGAYLYTDCLLDCEFDLDVSYERCSHLLKRIDLGAEAGFQDFHANDDSLIGQPILRMSHLTQNLLNSIDYENVRKRRLANFEKLDKALKASNLLSHSLDENSVPMVYPYLSTDGNLRDKLIANRVYVARYWPNVLDWCREGDWEYTLAKNTCYLPVDQRYGENDMMRIIDNIIKEA